MTQPNWYLYRIAMFPDKWSVIASIEKPTEKILWVKLEKT